VFRHLKEHFMGERVGLLEIQAEACVPAQSSEAGLSVNDRKAGRTADCAGGNLVSNPFQAGNMVNTGHIAVSQYNVRAVLYNRPHELGDFRGVVLLVRIDVHNDIGPPSEREFKAIAERNAKADIPPVV